MKFHTTPLQDAILIEQTPFEDERGYFARAWCADEFAAAGIETEFVQMNMSACAKAGTLRGMHYQTDAAPEAKLIRCVNGRIYDVMVDMRPNSPTYLKSWGVELTAENRLAAYIPPVFAHAYLALTDDAEVLYQVSAQYAPKHERGVRFDDPLLAIEWPIPVTSLSDKDKVWPDLTDQDIPLPDHMKR